MTPGLSFQEIAQMLHEPLYHPVIIGPHCLIDEDEAGKTVSEILLEMERELIESIGRLKGGVSVGGCGPRPDDKGETGI